MTHGGWARPYADEVMGAEMGKGMSQPGVLLFGQLIHPLTLGPGERLFPEHSSVQLKLISSVLTTTGVIIARYQPA